MRDIARLDMLSRVHAQMHDGFLRLKGEGRIDSKAYQDLEEMRSEAFWETYDYIARAEGE